MSTSSTIAIVGATSGLGSALARRLAVTGFRLVLGGRNERSLQSLASEVGAVAMSVNGADFAEMDSFFDQAAAAGGLSGVVNCAGSLLLKPAHRTTREEYAATIASNLTTAFATVRSAVRVLRPTGGSIVLVSSAAAAIGLQNHEAIAAAKAGVAGLTRAAAATYASQNIRVNAIAPGMVETPMTTGLLASEAARQASLALHPTGRAGSPEDLASLIAWLLGPEATWVTGQVWGIDGGLAGIKMRPRTRVGTVSRPPDSPAGTSRIAASPDRGGDVTS